MKVNWLSNMYGVIGSVVVAQTEAGNWMVGRSDTDVILWCGASVCDAVEVAKECVERDERAPAAGWGDVRLSGRVRRPAVQKVA